MLYVQSHGLCLDACFAADIDSVTMWSRRRSYPAQTSSTDGRPQQQAHSFARAYSDRLCLSLRRNTFSALFQEGRRTNFTPRILSPGFAPSVGQKCSSLRLSPNRSVVFQLEILPNGVPTVTVAKAMRIGIDCVTWVKVDVFLCNSASVAQGCGLTDLALRIGPPPGPSFAFRSMPALAPRTPR